MSKPIALECKNCGASLHNNQRECEYCRTEYRWSGDYRPYVGPEVETWQSPVRTMHGTHVPSTAHYVMEYRTAGHPW